MFDVGSLVSSIAGLGVKLGTEIPGLKKPKRTHSGTAAANAAAHKVASAAVGGAQAGHGASRGLALRTGLRAASGQANSAAAAQGAAALADERHFEGQVDDRNKRLADLGAGIAGGLGQMAQSFITPKGKDTAEARQEIMSDQPETQNTVTGLGHAGVGTAPERGALESTTEGLADAGDQQSLDQMEQELAQKNLELADKEAADASGPYASFASSRRLDELRAKSPTIAAPEIEENLAQRLRAKALMLQDAERWGIPVNSLLARINRRLDLAPGQSNQNPLGVSLGFSSGGEE